MKPTLTRDDFTLRGKSREEKFHIEDEEKEKVLQRGQWKNKWAKAAHKPC